MYNGSMRKASLLIFPLFSLMFACSSPIAQLNASTMNSNNESVTATINFSDFTQSSGNGTNDKNLRLGFTNSGGDTMFFVLAPKNPGGSSAAGLFPTGKYSIDQVASTFKASFSAGSESVDVIADPGSDNYINIQTIEFSNDGSLLQIQADFAMNFKEGGAGSGTMSVSF